MLEKEESNLNGNKSAKLVNSLIDGEVLICVKCEAINNKGNKFCEACGNKLENSITNDMNNESRIELDDAKTEEYRFDEVDANKGFEKNGVVTNTDNEIESDTEETSQQNMAFSAVKDDSSDDFPSDLMKETSVIEYVEKKSAFADGLPEWNIEPNMVISRKRK